MKFLLSVLMLPLIILILIAGLCIGFFVSCVNLEMLHTGLPSAHTMKGCLYIAVGIGLPAAVLSAVAGAALVVCAFVFKSWSRAIVCAAIGAGGFLIWRYFVNYPFPL